MEEILASIRRIIEDSDAQRSDDEFGATDAAQGEEEVSPAAAGDDEEAQPARSEEQQADVQVALADEDPEDFPGDGDGDGAPASLSDLQDMVRGEARHVAEVHPLHPPLDQPSDPALDAGSEPDRYGYGVDIPGGLDTDAGAANGAGEPASILSAETGRQVAAAFGELNEAFAANRKRNIDEMAREMLRPMLQDWLDNNLPTIVEKLVREEIERVARGG